MRTWVELGERMPYAGARTPVYRVTRRWDWRHFRWLVCSKRIGYLEEHDAR